MTSCAIGGSWVLVFAGIRYVGNVQRKEAAEYARLYACFDMIRLECACGVHGTGVSCDGSKGAPLRLVCHHCGREFLDMTVTLEAE